MTNKIKQIFIIKNSESETLLRLIFSFSQTECFHFCFFLLNVHSKQIQLNFIKLTNIFQQGSLPSTSTINRKRFIILTKPTFILTTICPSFPSSHSTSQWRGPVRTWLHAVTLSGWAESICNTSVNISGFSRKTLLSSNWSIFLSFLTYSKTM